MIESVLVFNYHGKARLIKFYDAIYTQDEQNDLIKNVYNAIAHRPDNHCNFVSTEGLGFKTPNLKIVYRHYATLYIAMVIDENESSLAILDLIQIFVETLDRVMENVCELDMVLNTDRVLMVLDELIMGGMVTETSTAALVEALAQQKTGKKMMS